MDRLTLKDSDRFWAKVEQGKPNTCWEWKGSRNEDGYGRVRRNGKVYLAHRIAFYLSNDRLPSECVIHTCDNPACCNPQHLIAGTRIDNNADRHHKGRSRGPKGENHPKAKLTITEVRQLRAEHGTGSSAYALAKRFGISKQSALAIVHRRHWKDA
mgnify:CR=1 FL=1